MCSFRPVFSLGSAGRLRHKPKEFIPRHCHAEAFVAIVLNGSYLEVGDTGRWKVTAGDVIGHSAYESHSNVASAKGAEVLLLPMVASQAGGRRLDDPDELVRVAEKDPEAAEAMIEGSSKPIDVNIFDWPDLLARDLRENKKISIGIWAREHGIRPETVSRKFFKTFGCSPAEYRSGARSRAAMHEIMSDTKSLVDVASETGYADQSHLTRSIVRLTGHPPTYWRHN